MTGKITIDSERCKGCGLCVEQCQKNCIVISKRSNKNGYFPPEAGNTECTGCALCAVICPEVVIEVYRDSGTVTMQSGKKTGPTLAEEKA